VNDFAHLRQRFSAPVAEVFDLLVDEGGGRDGCRSGFHRNRSFHHIPLFAPDLVALSLTCQLCKGKDFLLNIESPGGKQGKESCERMPIRAAITLSPLKRTECAPVESKSILTTFSFGAKLRTEELSQR